MEKKYYTPELSEFYIGFWYEIKTPSLTEFVETMYNEDDFNEGAFREGTEFRVKYIDEQDLIRLGWKQKDREWWMQDFVLTGQLQYQNVTIEKYGEDAPMGEWTHWRDTVFDGKLKNMNELQKVMGFLGIKPFISAEAFKILNK